MWECLMGFSTWAENNSGQIQIIIGVFAFLLAYKGYAKLLDYRSIDSKMVFLNVLHDSYRENIKYLQLTKNLKDTGKELKENINLTNLELKQIDENIERLEKWEKLLTDIKTEIREIYELAEKLEISMLETRALHLHKCIKEFITVSSGFNVISRDFHKIESKYK